MPSPSERDESLYVDDMLEFTSRALRYAQGLDASTLTADPMRYDAILRNIELIGEAATHVSPAMRALAPELPWREIVATRNRVAHGYLGISADTVWSVLTDDLPALLHALQQLRSRLAARPG